MYLSVGILGRIVQALVVKLLISVIISQFCTDNHSSKYKETPKHIISHKPL